MTQKKIKITDYSKYDKLIDDYHERKPFFEAFKKSAQQVLDHPEVSEDYKNDVRDLLEGLNKFQTSVEKIEFEVAVQKRKDEIMWYSIDLCNEQDEQL